MFSAVSLLSEISAVDTLWVLLGAVLVFSMQAGFALVETGLTRAKNSGNILMKNFVDFMIGSVAYLVIGFGIMFGPDILGLLGVPGFFGNVSGFDSLPANVDPMAFMVFQMFFCATAATIVSGAMAERTKFISYCIYSAMISLIIYPVSGHWIWGGGWLSQLGFVDFAGSTAVHMVGGILALIGAIMVGPRLGKYGKDGKPKQILGHNIIFAGLGVFILWFGWFGFNGGSSIGVEGQESSLGNIFLTTNMAACVGGLTALIITWVKGKKPDVGMSLNGILAGLVGVTAGCAAVDALGACLIGLICGFIVVFGAEGLDKLHVDDPVGAVAVHGMCGAAGTLMVGLFSTTSGLFYTGSFYQLGIQALGVVSVAAWVTATGLLLFFILKKTVGIRVDDVTQKEGLDFEEHGLVSAYGGFEFKSEDDFYGKDK